MPDATPLSARQAAKAGYAQALANALQRDETEGGNRYTQKAKADLNRGDLFFLLVYTLHRSEFDNDFGFERCREVQADPNGHLDLWAREHGKSTIITFALTIQDILNDPEITICIFSHNRAEAKKFLRQIKNEFENNDELKNAHQDVLWADPRRQAPKWSEDEGIIVKRRTAPKESTVYASGLVDGLPTGDHYKLLVYDDTVTRESVYTPEQIKRTTEAWELSLPIGTEGGARRMIGTRYHHGDTYRTVIDRKSVVPRIVPATLDGTETGQPVFLSRESLAEKRRDMGVYTFGCQMLQNPTADSAMGFKEEWLKYWDGAKWRGLNVLILVDPANAKRKDSDYTSIWVLGLGADRKIRVIDMVRDRLNLTERTAVLFALHRRYHPYFVGYERYGKDADIEHIRYVMKEETYEFTITELGGPMPKDDRIRRLVPLFENGRILMLDNLVKLDWQNRAVNLTRAFIQEEYLAFPVALHDDMLDALSRFEDDAVIKTWPLDPAEITTTPAWMKKAKLAGRSRVSAMAR